MAAVWFGFTQNLPNIDVRVCICNGVFINTNAYVYINTYG